MKHLFSGAAMALLLASPAWAVPHGKPGLWNVTATTRMGAMPQLPPQVLEMMKKRGMPGMGQPVTNQICMTAADVDADAGARMARQQGVDCTPKVLNQTATSATTEVTCHGTMEGVGRSQINWRGDSHYEGSYNFKGTMRGQPNEVSTSYSGDWVKSDCGAVKPFSAQSLPRTAPPPPR